MLIFREIRKPQIYHYIDKAGVTVERRRHVLTINFSLNFLRGLKQTVFVSTQFKRNQ